MVPYPRRCRQCAVSSARSRLYGAVSSSEVPAEAVIPRRCHLLVPFLRRGRLVPYPPRRCPAVGADPPRPAGADPPQGAGCWCRILRRGRHWCRIFLGLNIIFLFFGRLFVVFEFSPSRLDCSVRCQFRSSNSIPVLFVGSTVLFAGSSILREDELDPPSSWLVAYYSIWGMLGLLLPRMKHFCPTSIREFRIVFGLERISRSNLSSVHAA